LQRAFFPPSLPTRGPRVRLSKIWPKAKAFAADFNREHPFQLAASLSYYSLLSLAPLVLVVIAIAGVFGHYDVETPIVGEIRGLVGQEGAEVVQTVIKNAHGPGRGVVSLVIGVATLLIGATTVFVQLQSALNSIWEVKADPNKKKSALWEFVRDRLLSLAMILGIGFLLLVSLMISAALSAASTWAQGHITLHPVFWQVIDIVVSFGIIALLVAMMFKFLPDAEVAWHDVWFGAFVTSVLFTVGKALIGVYLGRASVGSAYGAAGSLVVFMVWLYYASLILFLGAKITQVRTRRERGKPAPVAYAVRDAHAARAAH
jgi:membrane protein